MRGTSGIAFELAAYLYDERPVKTNWSIPLAASEPTSFWIVLALIFGMLIGAGLVMMLVVRRRWAGPVEELARTASEMAGGNWSARVAVEGPADIERLGRGLNSLVQEAQARLDSLHERSANLKSLVDALPDPVLLADEQDRILLINAPAERLLQLPPQQVIGKSFLTVVSDPSILDLYETASRARATSPQRAIDREIRLVRRGHRLSFQAHAEPTPNGGLLVVLRDVSTLAATIQMKTDFVANASHELRTPISAIKVAFETLREVQPQDDQLTGRCITIIDGHLRRLEEMLRDLLDLSRVESADLKPHLANVRTADLLAVMRGIWSPVAADKGVELELPEPADSIEFTSDRRLLDLILKNLVENAIKFTPAGGRVVVVFARREQAGRVEVMLSVSDTGCGIGEEHKERVFERFYQVDSARSGSAGRGTGLGLAIVKHAVNAMAGQIQLQSKLGAGTTITCIFPVLEPTTSNKSAKA